MHFFTKADSWYDFRTMEESVKTLKTPWLSEKIRSLPLLSWGVFLVLFIGSVLVAFGLPFGPVLLGCAILGMILAYRYTYFFLYVAIFLACLLGLTVSVPVGSADISERAFAGSIDLFLGEIFLILVIGAWAIKVFILWFKRRDVNWKPQLPIWRSYLGLVAAHVISVFSSYGPDPIMVFKFILRPILFCYVAFIALPANLIRSLRRLKAVLGVLTTVGLLASVDGLLSLVSLEFANQTIRRAHPIPLFGLNLFGDNHNLLAETLLFTAPSTLALAYLAKKSRTRHLLYGAAALQALVALLTLARTAWIVLLIQIVFLMLTLWRHKVKQYAFEIATLVLIIMPLAIFQLYFSFSRTAQDSNATRLMLTEIAYYSFLEHPIIGGGAGTFIWRVGNARVFAQEFGDPLDAHGFAQKLMTETGTLGLVAYAFVLLESFWLALSKIRPMQDTARIVCVILAASAAGAVIYQFFNTAYWTAHLWLPIGILFAALKIFETEKLEVGS